MHKCIPLLILFCIAALHCGTNPQPARSLLRAAGYTSHEEFATMAREAVRAYLAYGFDRATGRYYGQLRVTDGAPVEPDTTGYWPGKYSDLWNLDQWPTHDYPMALADACPTIYQQTGDTDFLEGVHRWAAIAMQSTPVGMHRAVYAEQYGRCIHFLTRAGRTLNDDRMLAHARLLADEAVQQLYESGMFQGRPGTHLYESVDGVGYLFLALLELETGRTIDGRGLDF